MSVQKSITLLANKNKLLPIGPEEIQSVAIFGDSSTVHGGGSGSVVTPYVITPYQVRAWVLASGQ